MSLKRGRGHPRGCSRTRGGKSQRKSGHVPGEQVRPHRRGGCKKGRYSLTSRKKSVKSGKSKAVETRVAENIISDDSPGLIWNSGELPVEIEGKENVSNSEVSEFDKGNVNECDNLLIDDFRKSENFTGTDYGRINKEEDEHVEYGDDVDFDNNGNGAEDDDGDYYVDDYLNSDYQETGNRSASLEQVRRNVNTSPDGGSVSSDYSS